MISLDCGSGALRRGCGLRISGAMMFRVILSVCLILGGASAQVPGHGQCPEMQTATNLKLAPYMGTWYEVRRYFSLAEIADKCTTTRYKLLPRNKVTMDTSTISTVTGKSRNYESIARVPDARDFSKLKVKPADDSIDFEADYFVLGTDYKSWAIVYNCYQVNSSYHVKHAWILTRKRNASQSVINVALAVAEHKHLWKFLFVKADQSDC